MIKGGSPRFLQGYAAGAVTIILILMFAGSGKEKLKEWIRELVAEPAATTRSMR